jgi:hypothetical protein
MRRHALAALFEALVAALAAIALGAGAGCSGAGPEAARPRHPLAMEKLPPPAAAARKRLRVHVAEPGTVVAGGEVVEAHADDASLVRLYGDGSRLAVLGRAPGKTVVHLVVRGQGEGASASPETEDVDVEILAGEGRARGHASGETLVLSMVGVKEYSVGLPDLVATVLATEGSRLVVTGKKPGTTSIVLFYKSGAPVTHEIVVVGGRSLG